MRVYVMTDMEGVAGVLDSEWSRSDSRHYDDCRALLAAEVNEVVDGLLEGGASEVLVVDGHGEGAIDPLLLSPDAGLLRGPTPGPYPFGIEGYDAIAWVGQHAKAGTRLAHLPHTLSFNVVDYAIDGRSIGELGQMALCAALYGVAPIFAAGDRALTLEASEQLPGIETVEVKVGLNDEDSDRMSADEYRRAFRGAIHHPRAAVRESLRKGARAAAERLLSQPASFTPIAVPAGACHRRLRLRTYYGKPDVTLETDYPDVLTALNDLSAIA